MAAGIFRQWAPESFAFQTPIEAVGQRFGGLEQEAPEDVRHKSLVVWLGKQSWTGPFGKDITDQEPQVRFEESNIPLIASGPEEDN